MRTKESNSRRTLRVRSILDALDREYGTDYRCYLNYETPWQLLIAVILSAQCTDARVNLVTADLFKKYGSLEKFAAADLKELEQDIHSTGFYHTKAKNIIACCKALLKEYGGQVPQAMEDLLRLPGVGRKSANLIRGDIFHLPAVVADTHCIRMAGRLGFVTDCTDPVKVEKALVKVLPPEESNDFCHRCVLHGRAVCTARKAKCEACCLRDLCRTGRRAAGRANTPAQ